MRLENTRRTVVTLTFDNGPVSGVTERVLDTLEAHDVLAVFFVIGERAATPEGRVLVRRTVAAGHRVGAHTWRHVVPFGQLDDDAVRKEIDDTSAVVAELGGDGSLFRPYGGGGVIDEHLMSESGAAHLRDRGDTCVLWHCVPRDWVDEHEWLPRALEHIDTHERSVVVLHDIPHAAAAHLDELLTALRRRDVEFSQDFPDDCTPIRRGEPTVSYSLLGVGEPAVSCPSPEVCLTIERHTR